MRLQQLLENEEIVDDVVSYFDRQTDHAAVRAAIKTRYGKGIRSVADPDNADAANIETYVKHDWTVEVDAGMIESISVGFGQKVVNALSNLFSEPGQKFSIVAENEDTNVKEAEELLAYHREIGGFHSAITGSDVRSNEVGSGAVFINFFGGGLNYQTLTPSVLRVFHSDVVIEDGISRGADRSDLEDAYAITIRLSQVDVGVYNYLAIFSRSAEYTQGRWVEYQSNSSTMDIPERGAEGSIDYEINGQQANPLSYYAETHPDEVVPEFPISIIYGSVEDKNKVMPTSTSLYEDCLEYDLGASHTQSASQEGARGVDVLSVSEQGKGQPIPLTLSGQTVVNPGQELTHVQKGATEAKVAYETQKMLMIDTASGYGVPDFMVTSEDHTVDASSGIALEVKARPLKKVRDRRIEKNRQSVAKIYDIEKYTLALFVEESTTGLALLVSSTQSWEPGDIQLPENKKESAERVIMLVDKGLMDTIEAIREVYKFPTDAEAIEFYEKMELRKDKYPALVEPAEQTKKTVGLNFKNRQAPNA